MSLHPSHKKIFNLHEIEEKNMTTRIHAIQTGLVRIKNAQVRGLHGSEFSLSRTHFYSFISNKVLIRAS